MSKKNKKSKQPRELTPWDPAFKDLHQAILSYWGLQMLADVKLGKLKPQADLAIITPNKGSRKWKKHPLWKYVTQQNIVEFKSITDQLLTGDFEQLLVYTLLYRIQFAISYRQQLSAWLILPTITPTLRNALKQYKIELQPIYAGLWRGHCLFPLYVVAYNHLPLELPFASLKIFMKSSKTVQELLKAVIKSEEEILVKPFEEAMELIHPIDFKKVIENMKLSEQRKALRKTAWSVVQDEVDERIEQVRRETELSEKRAIARQMKAKGFDIDTIAELTGLSAKEIASLSSGLQE